MIVLKRWFRKVGFRFDAQAALLMCEQFEVELSDMDKIPKEEYVSAWCYNAHRSYSMYNYRKPLYSYRGMIKFIGQMPKNEWDLLLAEMVKAQPPQEKGEKKK
jgi:hypothetical protein